MVMKKRSENIKVLDLRELFGGVYKMGYDQAATPKSPMRKDPAYLVIPAKYGEFYPFDDSRVAFLCTSKRVAKRVLAQLGKQVQPYAGVSDDGDIGDECILLFEAEAFKAVAKIAKAGKKRALSEKRRQELVEQGLKMANYRAKGEGSSL